MVLIYIFLQLKLTFDFHKLLTVKFLEDSFLFFVVLFSLKKKKKNNFFNSECQMLEIKITIFKHSCSKTKQNKHKIKF